MNTPAPGTAAPEAYEAMVTPVTPLPGLSKGQAALIGDGAAAAPPPIAPRAGAAASAKPPMSKGQAALMGELPAEDDTYGTMTHGVNAGADADEVEPGEYRNIDIDEPGMYRNVEGAEDVTEDGGIYSNIEVDSNGTPIQIAEVNDDVYDSMAH